MDLDRTRLQALEDDGVLSGAEVTHALELQRQTGEPVDRVLTQLGLVSELTHSPALSSLSSSAPRTPPGFVLL